MNSLVMYNCNRKTRKSVFLLLFFLNDIVIPPWVRHCAMYLQRLHVFSRFKLMKTIKVNIMQNMIIKQATMKNDFVEDYKAKRATVS